MNAFSTDYPYLYPGLKVAARLKHWRQALALPADVGSYLLEITKFLATVALILASGLVMLMAG